MNQHNDGGRRPIGVLPSIVRVWERTLKEHVQRWLRENRREFDWATQGRSAESAAWHQALIDEAAAGQGGASATVFLDPTKAFEHVKLEDVWSAAKALGFPLQILGPAVEASPSARRMTFQKAIV